MDSSAGGQFDGKDPVRDEDVSHEDEFDKITEAAGETLREAMNTRFGAESHGLATQGFVVAEYLERKSRAASFTAALYEEGAPYVTTSLVLDDIEIGLIQAGLQVLTLAMDPVEGQDFVKSLLFKIRDAVKESAASMTEEQLAQLEQASARLSEKRMVEGLRALGEQLGVSEEETEEVIARAKRDADAFLTAQADDETGFTSGPLQ